MDGFFPDHRAGGPSGDDSEVSGDSGGGDKRHSGASEKSNTGGSDTPSEDWIDKLGNRELVYFLAGIIGVNPAPLTMRKLLWMSDGKERSEWNRASTIASTIHNVNCTKKEQMIDFKDIHPYFVNEALERKNRGPSKEEVEHGMMILKKALNG